MAPAAPQKRTCLVPLDDNSRGSNSSCSNAGVGEEIIKKKRGFCPLPSKRRLIDSSNLSASAMFKNFGVKPLPASPPSKLKQLNGKGLGFQRNKISSLSNFSNSLSPQIIDVEQDESGFFELTPENELSLRTLSVRSNSTRSFENRRVYKPVPNEEAFPPSFYLFGRRKLINKAKDGDFFSALPDEMILPILKWLPKISLARMAQVSQKFNRLSRDESLWRRIDLTGKFIVSEQMNVIISRKPVYLRLSQSKVDQPMGLGMDFAAPQLTYLDLSMVVIPTLALNKLLGMCSCLVKLSLEHVEISQDTLVAMEVFTHSIDTLNLTMCYDLPYKPLTAFLAKSSRLKSLNLGCVKQDWEKDNLMSVINSLPMALKELNMAGFRNSMVDTHVQILSERCTDLIHLDLSDCQELTMLAFEAVSALPKIVHLGLSRCYGIEMAAFSLLLRMKSLRYVEIYSLLKDSSIKDLEVSLPSVRINNYPFSPIARPTFGLKRSSIWAQRVRD